MPDAIVLSVRRWAWLLAALDSNNRPVFANVAPPIRSNGSTTGLVGSIAGIAVYATAGIAATLGGGSNEDRPLVLYTPDLGLLTSPPFIKIGDQHGIASTLSQQLVLYRYAAMIVKHASAIATITGSRSILPAGF